jgi:hypothetical protein
MRLSAEIAGRRRDIAAADRALTVTIAPLTRVE